MAYIDPQAQLKADYADLGVSTGYIGNFERWGDDRRFYVFTRLSHKAAADCCSVSIPIDVKRGERGKVLEDVVYDTPAVRAHLDEIRAKFNDGKLFWVGKPRSEEA